MVSASKPLHSLELFTGAGGLALGIERAGFKHRALVEVDGPACDTIRLNQKNGTHLAKGWSILESDVAEIDFTAYRGEVDLVAGGPPCQPFSQGGKHRGRSDSRDQFPQFIRAVREMEPRAFVIENVRGLTRPTFFKYFEYIKLQLEFPGAQRLKGEKWIAHRARLERLRTHGQYTGLQYSVVSQVLSATDFGVPQRRERVFIVGVLADSGIEYSFPVATHTREALLYDQFVSGEYWDRHRIAKKNQPSLEPPSDRLLSHLKLIGKDALGQPWRTVRDAISDLPRIRLGHTSKKVKNHFLNPGARVYRAHGGSVLDAPSKTIKAGFHGVPGGENIVRLDNGSIRYYSVRECARLQTFPDEWSFSGSWTSSMKQLGNAVPVTLGEIVVAPLSVRLQAMDLQ